MVILRDALLASLESIPGTRNFHLHALVTQSRKHSGLYPYATPRPRVFVQDVLILLSEQASEGGPNVFVAAIEAAIYHVPSTSSSLLYVAKVDSTGQAKAPSPTSVLVRAFLTFYASPQTRPFQSKHIWIHVFARSQTQYIFPNSADYTGKHVLTDVQLCGWWKQQLEKVATSIAHKDPTAKRHISYLLPGLNELEAEQAMRKRNVPNPPQVHPLTWQYGQPFTSSDIPSPCPPPDGAPSNLGHTIPYFDDDPKSRFLDDLVNTLDAPMAPSSPAKKRRKLDGDDEEKVKPTADKPNMGELSKLSAAEFWERMGFRQECVQGAITGFFALAVSTSSEGSHHAPSPHSLIVHPGEVSTNVFRRIHTTLTKNNEFCSTVIAENATSVVESLIRSLCEPGLPDDGPPPPTETPISLASSPPAPSTPSRRASTLEDEKDNQAPSAEVPVASPDTYLKFIYGQIQLSNPPLPPKNPMSGSEGILEPVTLLAVRKKKRVKP